MIGVPLVVVLIAAGVVTAAVVHHNNQVAAQRKAATAKAHRAALAAAVRQAAQQAVLTQKRAAAKLQRDLSTIERQTLVTGLQGAVKKDAEKDVSNGVLTGPITTVQCQPASALDATSPIANYSCLAATSDTNGVLSGYRFSATINVPASSYTWRLGG